MIGYKDKHEYVSESGITSTVYLMDCNEFMKQCKDLEFNLAVCDPPYGIGFEQGGQYYKKRNGTNNKQWDREIPKDDYFTNLFTVSKNQIIWGGIILICRRHGVY